MTYNLNVLGMKSTDTGLISKPYSVFVNNGRNTQGKKRINSLQTSFHTTREHIVSRICKTTVDLTQKSSSDCLALYWGFCFQVLRLFPDKDSHARPLGGVDIVLKDDEQVKAWKGLYSFHAIEDTCPFSALNRISVKLNVFSCEVFWAVVIVWKALNKESAWLWKATYSVVVWGAILAAIQ